MRALLIPVGSHGDVNPFIGLGRELSRRGHEVVVATNELFEPSIRRAGLEFASLGTAAEYNECLKHPDAWHPTKGIEVVASFMVPLVRRVYEAIRQHYRPRETVVAAGTLAFAARVAQEHLGIALASVHLQPVMFRSAYEASVLPRAAWLNLLPGFAKRGIYWLADALVVDRIYGPAINELRKALGMEPVRRVLDVWFHSPQRVLGLFPDWFARPQPDWPAQTRLTGFPLQDGRTENELAPEVREFLDAGERPIVFTPGSAMAQGLSFFNESLEACRKLGRRGMFVSHFRENIPERLPDSVRHFSYVPFGQLLPHAAAVVHHGGIGTSSQALAAGVPQLVMPFTHDQPDNAARLWRLGVARVLPAPKYRAAAAARRLDELLRSPEVPRNCNEYARRLTGVEPLAEACRHLEELAGTDR